MLSAVFSFFSFFDLFLSDFSAAAREGGKHGVACGSTLNNRTYTPPPSTSASSACRDFFFVWSELRSAVLLDCVSTVIVGEIDVSGEMKHGCIRYR
ncbi:hypothetical protein C8Q72DRAFT_547712 [Fomitopsis betulina]|nr:hypothetical protein C8Q72DRAFT_547712 [Fomitopsis betulina]